jgi:hypothetical protein
MWKLASFVVFLLRALAAPRANRRPKKTSPSGKYPIQIAPPKFARHRRPLQQSSEIPKMPGPTDIKHTSHLLSIDWDLFIILATGPSNQPGTYSKARRRNAIQHLCYANQKTGPS